MDSTQKILSQEAIIFEQQEKRWPKRTGCLDQKVVVRVTKQGGLSSTGNNEYGDNSQTGQ